MLYLVGLTVVACSVRIIWVCLFQQPPEGDPDWYDEAAAYLISGHGYAADPDGVPTAWRPPGYALILAAIYYAFGHEWLYAGIVQALIGSLCVPLTYWLART